MQVHIWDLLCLFSFFSVASYLKELLADSGIVLEKKCAIVQTAYANGSSTEYITNTLVSELLWIKKISMQNTVLIMNGL